MTRENIDKEIRQRVQAVETDIPGELEKNLMKELGQVKISLTAGEEKKNIHFGGTLAAVASVFLAVLLLAAMFPSLFRQKHVAPRVPEEDGVFVDSARVEGMPADTFIIDQKDPDITIIWIEKTPLTTKNRQK